MTRPNCLALACDRTGRRPRTALFREVLDQGMEAGLGDQTCQKQSHRQRSVPETDRSAGPEKPGGQGQRSATLGAGKIEPAPLVSVAAHDPRPSQAITLAVGGSSEVM